LRIWLDIGTKEGRDANEARATIDNVRLLKQALIVKGWEEGKDLKYLEAEGAEHNEKAWAARIDQILQFLFPKSR
jgi:predicted alpha/beta superfamily hydrolase